MRLIGILRDVFLGFRLPASPPISRDYSLPMTEKRRQAIELEIYDDEIRPDDKDANFKQEMLSYSQVDPLKTLSGLATAIGVPEGAIARYVLAKWASEGAAGILEVGPTMVKKLHKICSVAEESGDNQKRLLAFNEVSQIISWLNYPLDHPLVYE